MSRFSAPVPFGRSGGAGSQQGRNEITHNDIVTVNANNVEIKNPISQEKIYSQQSYFERLIEERGYRKQLQEDLVAKNREIKHLENELAVERQAKIEVQNRVDEWNRMFEQRLAEALKRQNEEVNERRTQLEKQLHEKHAVLNDRATRLIELEDTLTRQKIEQELSNKYEKIYEQKRSELEASMIQQLQQRDNTIATLSAQFAKANMQNHESNNFIAQIMHRQHRLEQRFRQTVMLSSKANAYKLLVKLAVKSLFVLKFRIYKQLILLHNSFVSVVREAFDFERTTPQSKPLSYQSEADTWLAAGKKLNKFNRGLTSEERAAQFEHLGNACSVLKHVLLYLRQRGIESSECLKVFMSRNAELLTQLEEQKNLTNEANNRLSLLNLSSNELINTQESAETAPRQKNTAVSPPQRQIDPAPYQREIVELRHMLEIEQAHSQALQVRLDKLISILRSIPDIHEQLQKRMRERRWTQPAEVDYNASKSHVYLHHGNSAKEARRLSNLPKRRGIDLELSPFAKNADLMMKSPQEIALHRNLKPVTFRSGAAILLDFIEDHEYLPTSRSNRYMTS